MVSRDRKKARNGARSLGRTVKPVEISNPELVFGLVGPIGVNLDFVINALSKALKEVGYASETIHLTDEMRHKRVEKKIDNSTYFKRYMSLIDYANEYRRIAKNAAALAGLAITSIRKKRAQHSGGLDVPALGNAYIIRQFKRPEEITLMRRAYSRKFILVSVYGNDWDRRDILMRKIAKFDPSPKTDAECERQAIKLIETDNNQVDDENGQRVSDVFHLGDVFVDGVSDNKAEQTITRFVRAFFGDNRISPNKDEYGLYVAASAAYRSVDLSRQVGAAIFSINGEVVSLGSNEVPKAGGGTYWFDGISNTFRDIDRGSDANQEMKNEILYDLIGRMSSEGFLNRSPTTPKDIQNYLDELMGRKRIKDSRLMDIIEFGRMIHAEMSAISDAARLGRPTKEATLYSTTFPCHLCAKHIVAAGIKRLVFLEPYPKSYAKKLHDDSITFDAREKEKVLFEPFIGISPRRYRDIFEKRKRKDGHGKIKDWVHGELAPGIPAPMLEDRSNSYIENEAPLAVYALGQMLSVSS